MRARKVIIEVVSVSKHGLYCVLFAAIGFCLEPSVLEPQQADSFRYEHKRDKDEYMSVHISPAPLDSHKAELIGLFRQFLDPNFDEGRFNWSYRQNPYGHARAWLAHDGEKGVAIGAAAAFPRKFHFDVGPRLGWVLGDFCIAEQYRSIGPAVQLQRACLEAIEPPFEFCYDFPSRSMTAVYRRLGIETTSCLIRWAKPLRIEDKLTTIVRSRRTAIAFSRIANVVLNSRGWKGAKEACDIEIYNGPFGEEFTALDESLTGMRGTRAVRTAAYLNWRYMAAPRGPHLVLGARKKGALVGYLVARQGPEDARIVDLASVEDPAVVARLLDSGTQEMALRGAATVSLAVAKEHPWNTVFRRAGFRPREASPIVVVTGRESQVKQADFTTNCFISEGDRDS